MFLYALVIGIHVIVCLVLIFVVLLQAGRGGGFSDMLGGGQPQSLFGTQTNQFLIRATEVCAVLFIVTSLAFGIMTTHRSKSLVERSRAMDFLKKQVATGQTGGDKAAQAATQAASTMTETAKEVASVPATTAAANTAPASAAPVSAEAKDEAR